MSKELERALELLRAAKQFTWDLQSPADLRLRIDDFLASQQGEQCTTPAGNVCPGNGVKSCKKCSEQAEGAQGEREAKPMAGCTYRLLQAHTAGEFSEEGGSPTVEAMAVESFDAQIAEGHFHDGDSYMAGFSNAIYAQALPMICLLDGEARAALAQPSPTLHQTVKGMADALRHVINNCDHETLEDIDYGQVYSALKAYEKFGASPSRAPAPELERPEVVGFSDPKTGRITYGKVDDESQPIMKVAQHDRIVGVLRFERQQMDRAFTACINERDELRADRDSERKLRREFGTEIHRLKDALKGANQERDAAQARVAELEKQEPDHAAFLDWAEKVLNDEQERLSREDYLMDSDDCIQALREATAPVAQAGQVPEGWKLVPVEPTPEMIAAAYSDHESAEYTGVTSAFRAMLAAAPQTAKGDGSDE